MFIFNVHHLITHLISCQHGNEIFSQNSEINDGNKMKW